MAGFSVGVWLVTFWRIEFRSDCSLSRCSSETSDGVAACGRNVRPLLSLGVESASSRTQAEICQVPEEVHPQKMLPCLLSC